MSQRYDRGVALVDEIGDLFTESDLDDADLILVTANFADVEQHPHPQAGMVVVNPGPRVDWRESGGFHVTWKIDVLVGNGTTILTDWERLDDIIDVLEPILLVPSSATPGEFPLHQNGPTLNGYILQHTESFLD